MILKVVSALLVMYFAYRVRVYSNVCVHVFRYGKGREREREREGGREIERGERAHKSYCCSHLFPCDNEYVNV